MRSYQQYQLDSLVRAQGFLDAHPELASLKGSTSRTQLDDAVAQAKAHGADQAAIDRQLAGQISTEKSLTTALQADHMAPIASFARGKLKGVPNFAALTKAGARVQGRRLVSEARAMVTAATPQTDALTKGGFPSDTVAQLGAAADALDQAISDRANAKVSRVTATQGLQQALSQGRDAVHMLDGGVRKLLVGNKTLIAGWVSAKRRNIKPGIPRTPAATLAVPPVPAASTTTAVPSGTSSSAGATASPSTPPSTAV